MIITSDNFVHYDKTQPYVYYPNIWSGKIIEIIDQKLNEESAKLIWQDIFPSFIMCLKLGIERITGEKYDKVTVSNINSWDCKNSAIVTLDDGKIYTNNDKMISQAGAMIVTNEKTNVKITGGYYIRFEKDSSNRSSVCDSLPRGPKGMQLFEWYTDPEKYATLVQIVLGDLNNSRKTKCWIWYIYPQSTDQIPQFSNYQREFESKKDLDRLRALPRFQALFNMVNYLAKGGERSVNWFSAADRKRIQAYRERYKLPSQYVTVRSVQLKTTDYQEIYLDVEQRKILAEQIKNIIGVKKIYGENCLNPGSELSEKITLKKLIGVGSYGNVYSACSPVPCGEDSYKFAVKLAIINYEDYFLPYNKNKRGWRELFLLKDIITPLNGICPNLPRLIDSYVCQKCNLNIKNTKKSSSCIIFLLELADGDLHKWFLSNPKPRELYNALFQIMAGIHTIQKHAQLLNYDIKTANILYYNVKPGGYFHYIIRGKDFYIPNIGKLFILNDFGVSISFDPNYTLDPLYSDDWTTMGNRNAIIIKDKFSPITSEKEYYTTTDDLVKQEDRVNIEWGEKVNGVWREKHPRTKKCESQLNVVTYKIRSCDPKFTQKQSKVLKKLNIPTDANSKEYYTHPEVIPPLELGIDTQDCIRMFTSGKRMSQRGDHKKYSIPKKMIKLLEKYNTHVEFGSNKISVHPETVLAGYFIEKFFTEDYTKFLKIPKGEEIGLYKI